MATIPDRAGARKQIRTSAKKKWNPDEEIARLHSQWVSSGGKEGEPDDDKVNLSGGARNSKGSVRPEAIKNLRTDVKHEYDADDWK
ncbi:hypothetical protein UFOVP27_36 [uncultured Caudovirales phage]|uniref:Uncharacterized protein n=1 Tax=uncultured Caudovirales phage TaxID=2100421 RepID=A0A6J5KP80_9CAUD|nr:hypothetical protein UFOVP27_36 [uncultured Caudovirales phage]